MPTLRGAPQPLSERILVDEVVEQLFAVQRDHRDPLEVGPVQRLVGRYVNLEDLEPQTDRNPTRTARASTHRWQPGLE